MPTSPDPAAIGKYEILSTIGRGGMGVVYKARDPVIDRIVAIKTISVAGCDDDSLLERLHMEARSAGRLQHPNIVTVFDFGEQDRVSFIVMEYVEGINLARFIDERRSISLDAKLKILVQIGDGLAYAHEHGVVHRDMKPSNVCVTAGGIAKILDFGLARYDDTRLTKTGFLAGTVAYMSPERFSGVTGMRDDIFALGAVAYELLTFQRAFPGSSPAEVMTKIVSPTGPPNPSSLVTLPSELDAIVQKALAKDIDERYETAALFADDLRTLLRSDSLHEFLIDDARPTLDRMVAFIDDRPSAHAYAGPSSSRSPAEPPPTLRTAKPPDKTVVVADVRSTGTSTTPEADLAALSGAPTRIDLSRPGRPRPRWWFAAAAAVAIGVVAGVFALREREAAPPPDIVSRKPAITATTATASPALPEVTKLQFATARSLSEELSRRNLNSEEVTKFSEATGRISLAEKKFERKENEAGTRLIADAIAGLQTVMAASEKRLQGGIPPPAADALPKARTRSRSAEQPRAERMATATPPQAAVPQPAPQPHSAPVEVQPVAPHPQPQPAEPAHPAVAPDPEKEISTFMRQLATAYQAKDVAFFREHSLRFSDALANAIRNSPSSRVELHVLRVDLADPRHAAVVVKRTDWFPEAGSAPAVQTLTYVLERNADGWQIDSIRRD